MDRADLTGTVLDGRYRVIEQVAEGAMGVIYRAERLKLGRIVAVKVLHDSLPNELSSRKRFELEAMAMARLEHPHCAAVVDVGVHGDRPFVVMDFLTGKNLREVIAAEAPIAIPRAIELLRQILSGLAHAHEHQIIHRDIKPANILLSQKAGIGDHVKLLDFGLARLSQDSSLTSGIVVGTPSYMAPEQIRGAAIDARIDLYASGVVLFELLTGEKPFVSEKDDPIEVCTMHLKDPVPRLDSVRPELDFGELEAVVARALAKSADDRYQTAEEFAAALDAIAPRRGVPTPVAGVPSLEQRATTEYAGVAPPESSSTVFSASKLIVAEEPAPASRSQAPAPDDSAASTRIARAEPPPPSPSRRRGVLIGVAALALAGAAAVVLSLRGGGDDDDDPPPAAAAPPDPAGAALARANELLAAGQKPAALDAALAGRKAAPRDPRLAVLAGRLYFDKFHWTEGLKQLRDALRLEPALRSDPELIKIALRGFITTPRADPALAGFLRDDIGAAAKPYLQETAADHPNPTVRARAAAELKRY